MFGEGGGFNRAVGNVYVHNCDENQTENRARGVQLLLKGFNISSDRVDMHQHEKRIANFRRSAQETFIKAAGECIVSLLLSTRTPTHSNPFSKPFQLFISAGALPDFIPSCKKVAAAPFKTAIDVRVLLDQQSRHLSLLVQHQIVG